MGLGTQAKQNKVSKQATQVSKQAHSKQASRQASNQPSNQTSPLIFMGGPEGVPHKNLGGGKPSKSSKLSAQTNTKPCHVDLCERSEWAKRNLPQPSTETQTKQRTKIKPSVVVQNFREICLKTRVSERESPAKSSNLSRPNKRQAGQVRLVRAKRASQE